MRRLGLGPCWQAGSARTGGGAGHRGRGGRARGHGGSSSSPHIKARLTHCRPGGLAGRERLKVSEKSLLSLRALFAERRNRIQNTRGRLCFEMNENVILSKIKGQEERTDAGKGVQKPTHQNEPSGWPNPSRWVQGPHLVFDAESPPPPLQQLCGDTAHTPHTIHTFQVCNSVVFSVLTELCPMPQF